MSLAPGLLLAAPPLSDPNFDRSVVLLAEHNEKGAFGWVINGRQVMSVADLCRQADLSDSDGAPALPKGRELQGVVRFGGPVGREQAWLLYPSEHAVAGVGDQFELVSGITVSPSQKVLKAIVGGAQPQYLFAVLGYAGWGPEQLEKEIQSGSWLPTDVRPGLVFEGDPERMWARAYQEIGVSPMAFMSKTVGSA